MSASETSDIESKPRISHNEAQNSASYSSTPSKSSIDQSPSIDLLNQLEAEANKVAASVDGLTENLTGILRSISALTLDCLETYRNCICKTCDTIDFNIKLMYQLMAKCEELSKVAEPLNALAQNIKDIRNVLDLFDNAMNPW